MTQNHTRTRRLRCQSCRTGLDSLPSPRWAHALGRVFGHRAAWEELIKPRVAAIENGVVHMHKVTIARDFGTQVEVSDGLKDGDQVILNPSVNLAEGSKVQAQPEQTASSSN